jgi:hypothetical protein
MKFTAWRSGALVMTVRSFSIELPQQRTDPYKADAYKIVLVNGPSWSDVVHPKIIVRNSMYALLLSLHILDELERCEAPVEQWKSMASDFGWDPQRNKYTGVEARQYAVRKLLASKEHCAVQS